MEGEFRREQMVLGTVWVWIGGRVRLTAAAKTVRYRLKQFLRALTAQDALSDRSIKQASEILPPKARALFFEQAPHDQRHALAVYETLVERGQTNKHLLTAALLHDVGKTAARTPPWQRGILVLVRYLAAAPLARPFCNRAEGWTGPLTTYARHPVIGADWAERAGCSALTVTLIRHHEQRPEGCRTQYDRLLEALRAADSEN